MSNGYAKQIKKRDSTEIKRGCSGQPIGITIFPLQADEVFPEEPVVGVIQSACNEVSVFFTNCKMSDTPLHPPFRELTESASSTFFTNCQEV